MTASLDTNTDFFAGHYIAGEWYTSDSDGIDNVIDPATGKEIGQYTLGSEALTEKAVLAARDAFETSEWAQSPRLRASVLLKFADNLEKIKAQVIDVLTRENGKLIFEATLEVETSISELRFYAGLARNIFGRMSELAPHNVTLLAKEPAGVAGIIVPWNAPVLLLIRSLAPAMAAGCTSVIKPAPQTPIANKMIMDCLHDIDELPKAVVNSINENGKIVGQAMVASPEIDVISFTGSSATGKAIMAAASNTLKRLSLELGGKAPTVVFPDADMDKTIAGITRGSLILSGQMCVAITRVLVHQDCAAEVENKLAASYRSIKAGAGYAPGSQMGPLIDKMNQQRVLGIIDQAEQEADLVVRGGPLGGEYEGGSFVTPSLFKIDDVQSSLIQEEIFGPVISLETFSSEEEAISKANATRYGLASSVWTSDLHRAVRVSRGIKAGTVWLNTHSKMSPESETGGYKESGLGRLHGVEGLEDFMETKNIYMEAGL